MNTLICSFDGLHDNRVLRYCADFEAHTLYMDTQTEAGEKVSVHFTGLLAHWFENVIQDWVTALTMRTKKRTSSRTRQIPWN